MSLTRIQPAILPPPEVISDAQLVERALGGDRFSRDLLYRRHAHDLLAIAIRLLANRHEGEEIVQEAFTLAFDRLHTIRDPSAFGGWLTRIAVNQARRRLRRGRLLRFLGLDRGLDESEVESLASAALRPDDRAELALADRMLRQLPANLRIAWMLRRVEGLPLAEVASACGCSLATVKRRIATVDTEVARHVTFQGETP
jgi:RNA polymerase sigma-70 factor (ECF subfamily)